MKPKKATSAGHRFPIEIISHTVWLTYRFSLSFRDIEELPPARGVEVTYESIRQWCLKFGKQFANGIARRQGRLGYLAPDIVEAILAGPQPRSLSLKRLLRGIPPDWPDQRSRFGFAQDLLRSSRRGLPKQFPPCSAELCLAMFCRHFAHTRTGFVSPEKRAILPPWNGVKMGQNPRPTGTEMTASL